MVDLPFYRRAFPLPIQILLLKRLLIRVIIPAEVQQLLSLKKWKRGNLIADEHDVGADGVEEVPVVRDHHEGFAVVLQEILEPDDRADVQVVRRLVQQQQIRRRKKRGSQRHSISDRVFSLNKHTACASLRSANAWAG